MKVIIVTRQGDGYRASVEGQEGVWGPGKTVDEAIGNLVSAHPEVFRVILKIK